MSILNWIWLNILRPIFGLIWEMFRGIAVAAGQGVAGLVRRALPFIVVVVIGTWIMQNHPNIIFAIVIAIFLMGSFKLMFGPLLPKKWR